MWLRLICHPSRLLETQYRALETKGFFFIETAMVCFSLGAFNSVFFTLVSLAYQIYKILYWEIRVGYHSSKK